ncbi:MAG: CehA/McbA family metallohydrolase [Armatimonadota bacterium]
MLSRINNHVVFPLRDLHAYPGSPTLDITLWLFSSPETGRRVWLLAPSGAPVVRIDDVELRPLQVHEGETRWIDYGTAELPTGFSQIRVTGWSQNECAGAWLVLTSRLDFSPAGGTLDECQRALWGIAQADAGTTRIEPAEVEVGRPATLTATYTAGPRGLPQGAVVRFSVPKAFTAPQAEDPDKPGYVQVAADCAPAIEKILNAADSHASTDIFVRLAAPLRPGGEIAVRYATARTYLFPLRFEDNVLRYWYTKRPPLAVTVAVDDDHPYVPAAAGHAVAFLPGPAERLHLFLPGRRHRGEEIALRGLVTDRYRNHPHGVVEPMPLAFDMLRDGTRQPLPGRPRWSADGCRFTLPLPDLEPGVYRVIARAADGVETSSNPLEILARDSGTPRLYWGEIHGHTEMSDGSGDFAGLYRHAREDGCLDFAAAADHACYFSDNQWQWMQDVTNAWNAPGRFVTLVGYEWAGKQCHRNLYTTRDRLDLFRGMYEPTSVLETVWRHFHGDDQVVGGPHGMLAHGVIWEDAQHDPAVERFVEIYSMWGAGEERDGPLVPDYARDAGTSARELLMRGVKVGFTGGGDCHEGRVGFSVEDPGGQGTMPHTFSARIFYRCGLTAAELPALDRPALIGALRHRRTYATTGARILLAFSVSGLAMGEEGACDAAECRAEVHATAPLQAVEVIKDGEVAFRQETDTLDISLSWQDPVPLAGESWYYLRVTQQDGHVAWSSPVWVRAAEG